LEVGTTFVELIKRQGTHLGVHVSLNEDKPPKIQELVQGSWAQRSDVLCVGDVIVGVNGVPAADVTRKKLKQILDDSDRIQLEVNYKLPPIISSQTSGTTPKLIQVTLRKENGSFGMVIRGGDHEIPRKRRAFTVFGVTPNGPCFLEGTIRRGDRIRAVNGNSLSNLKLPQLQGLLYSQESEAVFTLEYDVMVYDVIGHQGPLMVEIRREVGDILGFGLNRNPEDGNIYIESVKAASLADRCGALNVGDVLLAVNGFSVAKLDVDGVTQMIRGNPESTCIVRLEILPGAFSRNGGGAGGGIFYRTPMGSPCFSTLNPRRQTTPTLGRRGQPCNRHRSMTESDHELMRMRAAGHHNGHHQQRPYIHPATPSRERKKFVSFTVELQRDEGPLGLTLATEDDQEPGRPIFISALQEDGLAERTNTIQVNDQLLEVNGVPVTSLSLNEAIPLLQENNNGEVIRLKLARLISIPERDSFSGTLKRSQFSTTCRKPPLPSPSPCSRSSAASFTSAKSSPIPIESMQGGFYPRSSPARSDAQAHQLPGEAPASSASSVTSSQLGSTGTNDSTKERLQVPMEVHRVTLFKDNVYEDFGFSVSDGLYEKGIFVNHIRAGGPADMSGLLRPLDRILQINATRTVDYDCCLAVPLVASAGEKIELLVSRATRVFELRDRSRDSLERAFRNYHPIKPPVSSHGGSSTGNIPSIAMDEPDDATVRGCDSPRSLTSNYSALSTASHRANTANNSGKKLSRSKSTSNATGAGHSGFHSSDFSTLTRPIKDSGS